MTTRRPVRMTAVLLLAVAAAVAPGLSGCSSVGKDGGTDIAYVNAPDPEAEKQPVLTKSDLPRLFPAGAGRRWTMAIQLAPADPARQTSSNTQKSQDVVTIEKSERLPDGSMRVRQAFRMGNKVYRRETYLVTKEAIFLVDSSDDRTLRLSPPMPLVQAGKPAGKRYYWEGKITVQGETAPARAYGRVVGKREVTTPARVFPDAYRVDNILSFDTREGRVFLPSTRFFVPDVGIVRQTSFIGDKRLDKELIAYGE